MKEESGNPSLTDERRLVAIMFTDVVGYSARVQCDERTTEYARLLRIPTTAITNVHAMKLGYSTLQGDPRFEALVDDPKNNAPLF